MTDQTRDDIIKSLQGFKKRRDAVLHEDIKELEHHLGRFISFCETDTLVQRVLASALANSSVDVASWWQRFDNGVDRDEDLWGFPSDPNDELALRYLITRDLGQGKKSFMGVGYAIRVYNVNDAKQSFLSVLIRPLCDELTDRLSESVNIPSSEIRMLQAVPPNRIPGANETKIFLSHRSLDKPLVMRYYTVLKELGFDPWLDRSEMPAGTSLDRAIMQGFKESCAVVFFITDNFKDEQFIAEEIEYARMMRREKGNRFAIVTLTFSDNAQVPDLLKPYVFVHVDHELEGLHEILRALPVETGSILWKEKVVK